MQVLLLLGSINMAISVLLGAFGAHALKKRLSAEMSAVYQTAVQYQMAHALGLILVGLLGNTTAIQGSLVQAAGWFLFAGIVLFCGSLYVLSLTGVKKFGAITPMGGLAFIVGWILVSVSLIQG
jgi:uncharacterized membrane protein YgdD (TMEM256/DUF423 family)